MNIQIELTGPTSSTQFTHISGPKASGVRVDDSVIYLFQDMKCTNPRKSNKKVAFFCFSSDEKSIIVDPDKEILIDDNTNFFPRLKAMFPLDKCCYVLMDIHYITQETGKDELIFVMWAPEDAPIKEKLMFASSKNYLKEKFKGIKKYWELHSLDELTIEALGEKLTVGQNSNIKSVEGHLL
ncbi:destrin [Hyla sarda]|uniref:destrin n=1 Tax=Hyla sarda TaxID=327740 RepID=UPI0024C2EEA1|nr:destrin [Hyla sarda]